MKYENAVGMFLGLAIGDALGAPLEFMPSRQPEDYVTSYIGGGCHKVSAGEFTDDTSMALAMADAFIIRGHFDPILIMDNFLKWKNKGEYSPRGYMFDCGLTIYTALEKYEKDSSNPFCGSISPHSSGNGGLMRLAPAIIIAKSEKIAVDNAVESTRLTHASKESLLYSSLLAKELYNCKELDETKKYKLSKDTIRSKVKSGGYVKETYQAAWWAFQTTNNFEDCVIEAVNLGNDSDTTGAVAGMIAGAIYGLESIPSNFIDGLMWNEKIIESSKKLYEISKN